MPKGPMLPRYEAAALHAFLQALDRDGFKLPFRFAAIPRGGMMLLGEYYAEASQDVACRILAEHATGTGSVAIFPINFIIVDAAGAAARLVIDSSGEATGTLLQ